MEGMGNRRDRERGTGLRAADPLDFQNRSGDLSSIPPQGLSGVPLGPHGSRPVGFFFGPTVAFLLGNPVDRGEEPGIPFDIPPQGLSGDPLGPHGLRPVGFFFFGNIRWPIG